ILGHNSCTGIGHNGIVDDFHGDGHTAYSHPTVFVDDVVVNRFNVSDELLLKQYILENSNIDISYALMEVDDLNLPIKISPMNAFDYFENNRKKFLTPTKVNFKFMIIPFQNFSESVESEVKNEISTITTENATITSYYLDSLKTYLTEQKIREKTRQAARSNRNFWEQNLPTDFPIWESGFLSISDSLGNLPSHIVKKAFSLKQNEFSKPIEIENFGYIIIRNIAIKEPTPNELNNCRQEVWYSFVKNELASSVDKKTYYKKNVSSFNIPVAVVRIISNVPQTAEIEIKQNYHDLEKFRNIINKYNLDDEIKLIYLEKFKNENSVQDVIAKKILVEQYDDFINYQEYSIFYTTLSIFPQYLPDFNDIKDQIIIEEIQAPNFTQEDYLEYYEKNKTDFLGPDSLQLGGVYYHIEPDTIKISLEKSSKFYRNNEALFYRDDSVVFDYICTHKKKDNLISYLKNNADFEILKYCFNTNSDLPANELTAYSKLPKTISGVLKSLPENNFSNIIQHNGRWFIFFKKWEHKAGKLDFTSARTLIENQLKFKIADSLAYTNAKTVFDSTTYFGSIYKYANSNHIFKTKFRNATEEFEILGDISAYKKDLLQLWRNEKYASIINLKKGYSVVFLLRKKTGKQLSFQEALPQIKAIFLYQKKLDKASNYAEYLKELILQGDDPKKIFYFLGGWQRIENLDLNSELPGIKYSKTIIEDITKHESGYISPIIRIPETQLLIYRINSINKVSESEFKQNKEEYREEKIEENYNNWLKRYKDKHNIIIYEEEN
ncbi:MAG: hypothetical protein SVM86_01925, partial [Candidatus Cloacimonadota bacterium]|nr:hypothetical protein [Candidatus Cloacimonadota bacterium]